MKLHLDNTAGYLIKAYNVGSVQVNDETYTHNLIVMPELLTPWQASSFETLTAADFEVITECKPELVLLGTGEKQQFPDYSLMVSLIKAGIGVEVMNTQAACRTYNIVASEGRQVAAALLLG